MRAGTVGRVIKTQGKTLFNRGYITGWGSAHTSLRVENNNQVDPNLRLFRLHWYIGYARHDRLFWYPQEGQIKEGDTVLVSGAAGAVGSVVGQIAKLKAVE